LPTARRAGWVGCNFDLSRVPAEARIEIISTRSSGRESAHLSPGSQSRLTSAATTIVPPSEVRAQFRKVKPLKELSVKERGWTLDVLNLVRRIVEERGCPHPQHFRQTQRRGKVPVAPDAPRVAAGDSRAPNEFTNEDVYAFARELEKLHPDNRHIRDKIRQQLQVLRDLGLLRHIGSGLWRLP
jgi:type II restriction enzyme